MKPAPFEYFAPGSEEEILDLGRCPSLAFLRAETGSLVCGAMTRQIKAEESPLVRQDRPLLAAATGDRST